jgi:hypothetical protein
VGAIGTGTGKVFYGQLDRNGNPGPWQPIPGDLFTRSGVAAVSSSGSIYIVAVGRDFRLYYQVLTLSAASGKWEFASGSQEVPGGGITGAKPELTSDLRLYIKGIGDGMIYTKKLFDSVWSGI